jgi:hypothetical protein
VPKTTTGRIPATTAWISPIDSGDFNFDKHTLLTLSSTAQKWLNASSVGAVSAF